MPRDFSVPYTEAELEGLKDVFRTLPTFKDEGYILSSDIGNFAAKIGYERTPEQIAAYKAYYDHHYGGIIVLSSALNACRAIHNLSQVVKVLAGLFDKNNDGFISAGDYDDLFETLIKHEPRLCRISFGEFLKEADTNVDGKVSIEECAKWIESHVS